MIIQPSFNLKQILEVYPIAQGALQILLAIIITRIITRPSNPIAKDYAKKITKIGLVIILILVIVSTFFPDTKNLTATYNKETQNVEQLLPLNLASKKTKWRITQSTIKTKLKMTITPLFEPFTRKIQPITT